MRWRNTPGSYGAIAVALHWLVALLVPGLFGLGIYMRDLGYYDPLYRVLPQWHKELGVVLLALVLWRFMWRAVNPPVGAVPGHQPYERYLARATHLLLYLLPLALAVTGWLIVAADGRAMTLWDSRLSIPALQLPVQRQEELAGAAHWYLALALIALATLHAAAALKHHFVDRDRTLLRIFGR